MSDFSLDNRSGNQTQIPSKPPDINTNLVSPTSSYKDKLLENEIFTTNTHSSEETSTIPMEVQSSEPGATLAGKFTKNLRKIILTDVDSRQAATTRKGSIYWGFLVDLRPFLTPTK